MSAHLPSAGAAPDAADAAASSSAGAPGAPSAAGPARAEPGDAPQAAPGVAGTTGALAAAGVTMARWALPIAVGLALLAAAALVLAWTTQQRVKTLEAELVKRQQDSGTAAGEARLLARRAEESSREVLAKMALLEARVAENAMVRSQFEELIQSRARSRDENVLADLETGIRVALQQAAITGSAEPLALVLRQADERLSRYNQPRLERVRRAVLQDLDRARAASVTDISVLALRLDDVIRQSDELPLLSSPAARAAPARRGAAPVAGPAASAGAGTGTGAGGEEAGEADGWLAGWQRMGAYVWQEVKGLVRVTRIDSPEAMLVAPEQAWFLRENLKLRLLNARLALLSRQFETAQSDLRDAIGALEHYFDRSQRRTTAAIEALRQVMAQARTVQVPRPDGTLAAIAAAAAGR